MALGDELSGLQLCRHKAIPPDCPTLLPGAFLIRDGERCMHSDLHSRLRSNSYGVRVMYVSLLVMNDNRVLLASIWEGCNAG
jgi:hypothetical protein